MTSAFITGLAGEALLPAEARFLKEARPCGIILFARNCSTPAQVEALVADARAAVGSDRMLVLIDQEGGRVRRLRPPHWRDLPPAAAFDRLYRRDPAAARRAAWLAARLTAADLKAIGIDTNCAPVLDVPIAGAHDIIGDRAYGTSAGQVAALGRAVAEGLMAGGVVPVIKHIPGHGRAAADSHLELPVVYAARDVLARTDFAPFAALSDMPAAMTAHVVYTSIDPAQPASTSATVMAEVVRGAIGFSGLVMSDDLGMKALSGPMRRRAEAVISAGSDVALHCSGILDEMEAVAAGVPGLAGVARARFERCLTVRAGNAAYDVAEATAALAAAMVEKV